MRTLPLPDARHLPVWRRPVAMLFVMTAAMPFCFEVWFALLNNFMVEIAKMDGAGAGLLHSVREIPGFLSFAVVFLLLFIREQLLGVLSLLLLGVASALTAYFPSLSGLLVITFIASVGFHYYETVNQSLQLQWIAKDRAPVVLGWMVSVASISAFIAYVLIVATWQSLGLSYEQAYLASGGVTAALALFCLIAYPQFQSPTPQRKHLVLRKRYWLYYALNFMAGARRQIFLVFAAFMMVERFGFDVHEITWVFLITLSMNILLAPMLGKLVQVWGERNALVFEYSGLCVVFLCYAGLFVFDWGWQVAACLYILDNMFFALRLAMKTYFQKIADPRDIAPTAAVAFTINHIAAVGLPVVLGLVWIGSPTTVFYLAAGMAFVSLLLSLLIPRHPTAGRETVFQRPLSTRGQAAI